jgi:hypothetical protein
MKISVLVICFIFLPTAIGIGQETLAKSDRRQKDRARQDRVVLNRPE